MTDKPTIYAALASVMEDVRSVSKTGRNEQQRYLFRGIDATVNAVGPVLRKHGVVVVPMLQTVNYRDVQTSGGKPSRECTVTVQYRFYGPAGDYIDCVTPGESMDFGDKGAPKAMSVAFRIALLQALCLPTDDADPDAQSYERESAVGRGQTPKAPHDKYSGTDPDEIKGRLRADCELNNWDLPIVAALFESEHKTTLKGSRDAKAINRFWQDLYGIPSDQLRQVPETAENAEKVLAEQLGAK